MGYGCIANLINEKYYRLLYAVVLLYPGRTNARYKFSGTCQKTSMFVAIKHSPKVELF